MGPALGAPLQAIDFKFLGVTVDGNNGPGVVLLFAPRPPEAVSRLLCCFSPEAAK